MNENFTQPVEKKLRYIGGMPALAHEIEKKKREKSLSKRGTVGGGKEKGANGEVHWGWFQKQKFPNWEYGSAQFRGDAEGPRRVLLSGNRFPLDI